MEDLAKTNKYPLSIRILHWLIGTLFILEFFVGFFMREIDDQSQDLKTFFYKNHKSFGMLILLLVIYRIILRIQNKAPKYSDNISNLIQILSKLTHYTLYLLMIIIPITGIGMSLFSNREIFFFGLKIPNIFNENKNLAGILYYCHMTFPYALIYLVGIHMAAALKHLFINKDEVFSRMSISLCKKNYLNTRKL